MTSLSGKDMDAICGHISGYILPHRDMACFQIKEFQICELAKVWELGMRLIFTMITYIGLYFILVKKHLRRLPTYLIVSDLVIN